MRAQEGQRWGTPVRAKVRVRRWSGRCHGEAEGGSPHPRPGVRRLGVGCMRREHRCFSHGQLPAGLWGSVLRCVVWLSSSRDLRHRPKSAAPPPGPLLPAPGSTRSGGRADPGGSRPIPGDRRPWGRWCDGPVLRSPGRFSLMGTKGPSGQTGRISASRCDGCVPWAVSPTRRRRRDEWPPPS